jgi:protein-S-isoprenylcysteine O-methyltransferase Ste14
MAGRIAAGSGQLFVAVVGFTLFVLWFVNVMVQYYALINGPEAEFKPRSWLGIAGVIVFGVAWLWALSTSISVMREAGRSPPPIQNQ